MRRRRKRNQDLFTKKIGERHPLLSRNANRSWLDDIKLSIVRFIFQFAETPGADTNDYYGYGRK